LLSDTYTPQVNGVTTVVARIVRVLREFGHDVVVVAPRYPGHDPNPPPGDAELRIPSAPFPPYPAIRLSLPRFRTVARYLDAFQPDLLHVATEGSIGLTGRRYAVRRAVPLVTSYHTNFPQYARHYGAGLLEPLMWRWLRWFHGPASGPLSCSPGRGAAARRLVARMPWVRHLGFLDPERLATLYASADICVLPSATETCGLVALEAMASGLAVIAADAGGFRESIVDNVTGLLAAPRDAGEFAAEIAALARFTGAGAASWARRRATPPRGATSFPRISRCSTSTPPPPKSFSVEPRHAPRSHRPRRRPAAGGRRPDAALTRVPGAAGTAV